MPLFFQFARYERYLDPSVSEQLFTAASEPKSERWYPTGHELNDPQAIWDLAEWLHQRLGISSPDSILTGKPNIR